MAESTLSITYTILQREVGRYLGWNRDPSQWSADQLTDFLDCLRSGLRRFYFPPSPDPQALVYEWTFLKPIATIALSVSNNLYTLADNCGGVVEDGSLTVDANVPALSKISEREWRQLLVRQPILATPRYWMLRPKTHNPTVGQRWEIGLFPTPDISYTLSLRYVVIPDSIDATNIYPLGGAAYSELILEAVLSAAEKTIDDEAAGPHEARFNMMLTAAIRTDRETREKDMESS